MRFAEEGRSARYRPGSESDFVRDGQCVQVHPTSCPTRLMGRYGILKEPATSASLSYEVSYNRVTGSGGNVKTNSRGEAGGSQSRSRPASDGDVPAAREGEPCPVLGGLGKSYLALRLALTATDGGGGGVWIAGRERDPCCLIGYDDSRMEVWRRLLDVRAAETFPEGSRAPIPPHVQRIRKPPPLFEADPEIRGRAMRCEKWAQLFATIRAQRPVLVVIDPILRALAGGFSERARPGRGVPGCSPSGGRSGELRHPAGRARHEGGAQRGPGGRRSGCGRNRGLWCVA